MKKLEFNGFLQANVFIIPVEHEKVKEYDSFKYNMKESVI